MTDFHKPSCIQQRLAKLKEPAPSAEMARQLRQSVDILNRLLNENAHRPDATRLLRNILQERAEKHALQTLHENSLSG
jgi:hypothetical protein